MLISRSVDGHDLYLLRVGWDSVEDHVVRFAASDQGAALGELIGHLFAEAPVVHHFEERNLSQ